MTAFALISAVFFVIANGFFVAVEFAAVGARRTEVDRKAETGGAADRAAQRLQQSLTLTLGSAQLGITACSLALGKIAEPAVAHLLEDVLHDLGVGESLGNTIGFTVALSLVVFVHIVVGEMVPKNMTILDPSRALRALALPMAWFVWIAKPMVVALNAIANGVLLLIRVEPVAELEGNVTVAELANMVRQSEREGVLDSDDSNVIAGALAFGTLTAVDVMVPIADVDAVPVTATVADTEATLVETQHTRLVVYEGSLEQVRGFVHGKDLLGLSDAARQRALPHTAIRPMVQIPLGASLPEVLLAMRRRQTHMGVVVEDRGEVAVHGVLTMDAVLASLVPDTHDV